MATQIYKDGKTGEHVVQTTCLDTASFIAEISEALSTVIKGDAETTMSIMTNAMPIAFKLSGYKADDVRERRTLVCGNVSPDSATLISSAGK